MQILSPIFIPISSGQQSVILYLAVHINIETTCLNVLIHLRAGMQRQIVKCRLVIRLSS